MSLPFSPLSTSGTTINIDVYGKTLVIPTENYLILPSFNEYTLSTMRCNFTETPCGGLKNSLTPDLFPGTISIVGEGCFLLNTTGTYEDKTISAGKLSETTDIINSEDGIDFYTADNEKFYVDTNEELLVSPAKSIIVTFLVRNTTIYEQTYTVTIRCPDNIVDIGLFNDLTGVEETVTFTKVTQTSGTVNSYSFTKTLDASSSDRFRLYINYFNLNYTYQFTNDANTATGLENMLYPWIGIYDPASTFMKYFLFTDRVTDLSFLCANNAISQLNLSPGDGVIYQGDIQFSSLTTDSDSDTVPDVLDINSHDSLARFLRQFRYPYLEYSTPGGSHIAHEYYIDATTYGMVGNNSTDNTTAFNNAIAAAMAAGTPLFIPPGVYKISGQITLPNNGAAYPLQRPLTIFGSGSSPVRMVSYQKYYGGTVLDMTYSGSYGKFISLGLGNLRIEGITFIDTAVTTTPWIYVTNTVCQIRYNAFVGNHTGLTNDQDCIILGGINEYTDGTCDSAFSGWGTVIQNNFFDQIRRALYGRMWANAINFSYNSIWNHAGSNLENGAAIEFDNPDPASTFTGGGNIISNNFIEMIYYPYAVKLRMCMLNTLSGNTCYDASANTKAVYYFDEGARYNTVLSGGYPHSYMDLYHTYLEEDDPALAGFTNLIIDNHGTMTSSSYRFHRSNGIFTGSGNPTGVLSAPIGSIYMDTAGSTGSTFYVKESGTGSTGWVAK